jgi:hypothetical protein
VPGTPRWRSLWIATVTFYQDAEDEIPDRLDALLALRPSRHTRVKLVRAISGRGGCPLPTPCWVAPTGFEPMLPP